MVRQILSPMALLASPLFFLVVFSTFRSADGAYLRASNRNVERTTLTTKCVDCDQSATNQYDRPDDKEKNGLDQEELWALLDKSVGDNDAAAVVEEEEDLQNSSESAQEFVPSDHDIFQESAEEGKRGDDNDLIAQDEKKLPQALEDDVECEWCHGNNDYPPKTEPPVLNPDDLQDDQPRDGFQGTVPDDPYDYPNINPPSYSDRGIQARLIDDMVAPFFLLAAILLILALVYTLLFLCVVRLGTIRIDEDMYPRGRVYFCGNVCFVPLCWFYRLYAADPVGGVGIASSIDAKVMGLKREERKEAVAELLKQHSMTIGEAECAGEESTADNEESEITQTFPPDATTSSALESPTSARSPESGGEDEHTCADANENQCSICLDGYEPGDIVYTSTSTCTHRFHHDCLLDWLTRRCNTACPCCRRDLISNEDVWNIHTKQGREKKRRRKKGMGGGIRDHLRQLGTREGREEGDNGNNGEEILASATGESSTADEHAGTDQGFQSEVQEIPPSSSSDDV